MKEGTQEKEFFSDAGHCACSRMETVRGFNNRRSSPGYFGVPPLSEHKTAHEKEDHREEYVTEINGYDMGELSIYQALRVYDLLEANGLTDYEGRGYDRSYNYGVEDFRPAERTGRKLPVWILLCHIRSELSGCAFCYGV